MARRFGGLGDSGVPGMMTDEQRKALNGRYWPAACRQQGWTVSDRSRLYAIYAEVLGDRNPHKATLARGDRISGNDFISNDQRDDFGDVKRRLQLLAGKDLLQEDPVRR